MEVSESLSQQDHLQLIVEKKKWQTEVENKKRQLEDDRRALQHLKSKNLRERWLLDGAPSSGQEQNEVSRQLEQDEARTRCLEDTINRLEQELVGLEAKALCQTVTQTTVTSGPVPAAEVKGHGGHNQRDAPSQVVPAPAEVKVHESPRPSELKETTDDMKRAMYSVEIRVERDRVTGETRVLSTNTVLPVDLSQQGVKVYEDERKVVHEMNGEEGVHLLSSLEVEELIHKAEETSMMSPTVTTATSLPTAEVHQEAPDELPPSQLLPSEITGLEADAGAEPKIGEASADNPLTMVFMGYQSVEDEDETKKVLGLQGTVKAELVVIQDDKTSPGEGPEPACAAPPTAAAATAAAASAATATAPSKPSEANNREPVGEPVGEPAGGGALVKKEKQPCKCCSIM